MNESVGAKPISYCRPSLSTLSNRKPLSCDDEGVQQVYSCFSHLFRAFCSDVHIQLTHIIHLRRVLVAKVQVHRPSRKNTRDTPTIACLNRHGLRKVQRVEYTIRRSLWRSLHAEISIFGNFADHIAWLIDGRDD